MNRTLKDVSVADKISAGNEWFTASQFREQFNNPVSRHTLESRWNIWRSFINPWIASVIDQDKRKIRILDAGCGDGINLQWLYREFTEKKVSFKLEGIDYNHLRLVRAKNVVPEADISSASLADLPFLANCFDIVICNHVLEHIPEDRSALKEIYRVLKPNGILILGVPNEGCLFARLRNHLFQRSILTSTDHVNFYTLKNFLERLDRIPFVSTHVRQNGFFFPHLRLSNLLGRTRIGRWTVDLLGTFVKSQASDLILLCRK